MTSIEDLETRRPASTSERLVELTNAVHGLKEAARIGDHPPVVEASRVAAFLISRDGL